MDDLNTESLSAPQPGSIDIGGGEEEDGMKSAATRETSERTQCSSGHVETKSNLSGCSQPVKASWPAPASVPACQAQGSDLEHSGTVTLRMPSAILSLCIGESTVLLPVHLQMPPAAAPPPQASGPMASAPHLLLSNHGPATLPVVSEQQLLHCFNSQFLPQGALCSAPPPPLPVLQNNIPCQSSSVTFCQPQPTPIEREQRTAVPEQDGPPFVPSPPSFADILQDQSDSQNSFIQFSCQRPGANPTLNASSSSVSPAPQLTPLYPYSSSLLAPLVPPPTLLVPFPIVIPLPVPVPIPIPIPTPFSAKAEVPTPTCSTDVGTQTCTGFLNPVCYQGESEGSVLDLSVAAWEPSRLKQEFVIPEEDCPLDLSLESHDRKPLVQVGQLDVNQPAKDLHRSLEFLQAEEHRQILDSKPLSGLTSLTVSRHHKWLVDSHESQYSAGSYDIVRSSQKHKVIMPVKDVVPAIFQGKLRELSGMSPGAVSSRQDMEQVHLVRQHNSPVLRSQGETSHYDDPRRGRTVKFKKLNLQEIHLLPIKKQRFASFFSE